MDDEDARACGAFSIDIAAATSASLRCQLQVVDLVDDGTVGEAQVKAVVSGSTQPLNFAWEATAEGIELDDPTSQSPTVRFTPAFDRSGAFLVGFNVAAMQPDGEPVVCQAACGRDGQSGPLLGECFATEGETDAIPAPAPTLSHMGIVLQIALLMLIAAKAPGAGEKRPR
jgi:hypothetical protein